MKPDKNKLVKEYHRILKINDSLYNLTLDLRDYRRVVRVIQQLATNTLKLEILKNILKC